MKVLVACEMTGRVRRAFSLAGWDAWSCDLLPSMDSSPKHVVGDVRKLLQEDWDLLIAHPPCTRLAVSGNGHHKFKRQEQAEALAFAKIFFDLPHIPKICVENTVGILSTQVAKPTQIIQPWMFGHHEKKRICLWLKNLPKLVATQVVEPFFDFINNEKKEGRARRRSFIHLGVAQAMAAQWGK